MSLDYHANLDVRHNSRSTEQEAQLSLQRDRAMSVEMLSTAAQLYKNTFKEVAGGK